MRITILTMLAATALVVGGCESEGGSRSGSSTGTTGSATTGGDTGATAGDTGATAGDTGTDGTAATSGGGTTDGGGATTTSDGGEASTGTDGAAATTGCNNAADGAIINGDLDVTAEATTCGLGCIGKGAECAGPCVAEATGLSEGCATCYALVINCSIDNCVAPCASDPGGSDCAQCQADAGCVEAFDECAQLDADVSTDGGEGTGGEAAGGDTMGDTTGGDDTTDGGATGDPEFGDGACENTDDFEILSTSDVQTTATECGISNFGNTDAATQCIKDATGLTDGCTECFAGIFGCVASNCIMQCFDQQSQECLDCVADSCYPGFTECSGVDPNDAL